MGCAQRLGLFVLLCAAALSPAQAASGWPRVQPLDRRIEIVVDSHINDVRVPLLSHQGKPMFWLRCLAGTTEQLDALGDRDGNNYVAPLACVLVEKAGGWHDDLLSEDESAVWHSRGQYSGADLVGECARYPEFGTIRHFRLRGMQLTLMAEDVANMDGQKTGPSRMTLHVRVQPNPTARTARAERPNYQPPRQGDCHTVIRGSTTLMCRNETTLSWQACSAEQKRAMGSP